MSPARPPGLRRWLTATLWSAVLAVLLTWPMVLAPGARALGHPQADGMKHLWTLWWMRASVWREGVLPFATHLVNFPTGMELYPIEPLGGLAAVALPHVDVVLLSNLLVLTNLVLTGVAGTWFGFVVSGRWVGGLVAGTLLECSSVMAFFVHVGVGELQHLWWLPLGLGVLVRARRTGRLGWYLALAGALVGAILSGFYLGLCLVVAVAVWALLTLGSPRQWGTLLPRYLLAAGLALAAVLPVIGAFDTSYSFHEELPGSPVEAVFADQGQPVVDAPRDRLEPVQLLVPVPPGSPDEGTAYGGGRYMGWVALVLGVIGLVRRPSQALPWLAVGIVGMVLAMGSYLTADQATVVVSDVSYRLPGLYLNRLLSVIAEPINFPVRFTAVVVVALAALASLAVRRWGFALVVLAAVEIAYAQRVPWPWLTFVQPPMEPLAALADRYPGEGLIDLVAVARPDVGSRRVSLAAQVQHQHPVNTVPIERLDAFARDGELYVQALPLYDELQAAVHDEARVPGPQDAQASLALLQAADLRLILVHGGGAGKPIAPTLGDLLTQLCGPPVLAEGQLAVWRVPDQQVEPDQLARWQLMHRHLVEKWRSEGGSPVGRPLNKPRVGP